MSGLGCDRTHGRSGSAQIETNKFQSTLPEGSDRRHQQICGASLRRRVERPHHDTSQVVHLLKIPDFLFVSIFPLRQRHVPARLRHQRERQAFGAGVPSVWRIASTHTRWRQGPCRLRRMRLLLEGAAMADRPTTYGGRGMEIIGDDELRPGI